MKQFEITIKGTVVKTLTVEADDEQSAIEVAHSQFSTTPDGEPEKYNEDVLSVVDEGEVRKYEVPIVYRGQSNYIVVAKSPEDAERIARAMFDNDEPPLENGAGYESIDRVGDIEEVLPVRIP